MFFLSCPFVLLVLSVVPLKGRSLASDDEIPALNDLGSDVNAVFDLEVDEIWLPIFDLVESWLFRGSTLDVSKRLVVVDHRDKERNASGISVQRIVELELFLVIGFEFVHLLRHTRLGSMNLSISLRVKSLQFLLV